MNRKHLLLTILAFAAFALTAKAQVTVKYTIGGVESTIALDETTAGSLQDATSIIVTGKLTDDLLDKLRAALKDGGYYTTATNSALTSADLSGATLKTTGSSTTISNMGSFFCKCTLLQTAKLPVPDENVKTISFYNTFGDCAKLKTVTNLEKYTGVSNFSNTFKGCKALQSVTLPVPATPAKEMDFKSTFSGCAKLKTITHLELYTGVSNLVNTFYDCAALETVTLPVPATPVKVTDFSAIFSGCKMLKTITNLELYTGVSNFTNVIYNCAALETITLPEPTDATKETSFSYAFTGCTALQTIANLELYTNVSEFDGAFKNCPSLLYVKFGSVSASNISKAFDGCNPNCLKYLPAGTTTVPDDWTNYGNFLVMSADGEATVLTDITLTDAASDAMNPYYCPTAFGLGEHKITYTRDFTDNYATGKNGWNTLAVPFDAKLYADEVAQIPYATATGTNGNYWLRTLDNTAIPANESTVNFAPVTTIEAYTPYIIAIPGNDISSTTSMQGKAITFEASGITVPATPEAAAMNETTSGSYRFVPTFTPIREQKMYLLERGTGENPDTFTLYEYGNLLPFRAYIADRTGTTNAPRLAIGGSGAATGIAMQQLSSSDGSSSSTEIPAVTLVHSIDGRLLRSVPAEAYESRLDGLQPGIYLVNGQKEMVK